MLAAGSTGNDRNRPAVRACGREECDRAEGERRERMVTEAAGIGGRQEGGRGFF